MKELCRDLIGLRVRLNRRIETCGGESFAAGTEMRVAGTYRGRFHLQAFEAEPEGHRKSIRQVRRNNFDFLEQPKPRLTEHQWRDLAELSEPNDNPDNVWRMPLKWKAACDALVAAGYAKDQGESGPGHLYSITESGEKALEQRADA